jgi:hypothetical protein
MLTSARRELLKNEIGAPFDQDVKSTISQDEISMPNHHFSPQQMFPSLRGVNHDDQNLERMGIDFMPENGKKSRRNSFDLPFDVASQGRKPIKLHMGNDEHGGYSPKLLKLFDELSASSQQR